MSNFIMQALRRESITIFGSGDQTRSFCYVDDLIEGFIRLMGSASEFVGPVNLGNPTECTIRELAELIIKMTNSRSALTIKELPQDDPVRRRPNIDLAKENLSWSPTIELERGLDKTISYFTRHV